MPALPCAEWWHARLSWMKKMLTVQTTQHVESGMAIEQDVGVAAKSASIPLRDPEEMRRFKDTMLPLLDSAYSLARYLVRDSSGAEDIVQDVYLRALKAFDQYRGGDAKSWLLAIVRNCCMTWIANNARHKQRIVSNDEELNEMAWTPDNGHATPEQEYDVQQRATLMRELIAGLPALQREVLILRELEGLSYTQIAHIMQIPVGTVMSRLARARTQLSSACQQRGLVMS